MRTETKLQIRASFGELDRNETLTIHLSGRETLPLQVVYVCWFCNPKFVSNKKAPNFATARFRLWIPRFKRLWWPMRFSIDQVAIIMYALDGATGAVRPDTRVSSRSVFPYRTVTSQRTVAYTQINFTLLTAQSPAKRTRNQWEESLS